MTLLPAAPAVAMDAKIYPYASNVNYCPAGLQPVQIDGVISCGTPNQLISYQAIMAHPVSRKRSAYRRAKASRMVCPVGQKGCYMQ
ncbi:hypothetical protein [Thalassovita taeanensis]|nr:hypothetical protein [Thalassovita taeanensis]